jgi:hypothetical protein
VLELTLHGVRNNTEVAWTVLGLIVTDLHVHVHDFPNSVRLTCRRGTPPVDSWLSHPKILHPYLEVRFDAKHPR